MEYLYKELEFRATLIKKLDHLNSSMLVMSLYKKTPAASCWFLLVIESKNNANGTPAIYAEKCCDLSRLRNKIKRDYP